MKTMLEAVRERAEYRPVVTQDEKDRAYLLELVDARQVERTAFERYRDAQREAERDNSDKRMERLHVVAEAWDQALQTLQTLLEQPE